MVFQGGYQLSVTVHQCRSFNLLFIVCVLQLAEYPAYTEWTVWQVRFGSVYEGFGRIVQDRKLPGIFAEHVAPIPERK